MPSTRNAPQRLGADAEEIVRTVPKDASVRQFVNLRRPLTAKDAAIAVAEYQAVQRVLQGQSIVTRVRYAAGEETLAAEAPSSRYIQYDYQKETLPPATLGTEYRAVLTDLMQSSFGSPQEADIKNNHLKQKELEAWDEWRLCLFPWAMGVGPQARFHIPKCMNVFIGNLGAIAYPPAKQRDWDFRTRKHGLRLADRDIHF